MKNLRWDGKINRERFPGSLRHQWRVHQVRDPEQQLRGSNKCKFNTLKIDFAAKLKVSEVKVTQATSSANTASNKAKEANDQIKKLATNAGLGQYQKKRVLRDTDDIVNETQDKYQEEIKPKLTISSTAVSPLSTESKQSTIRLEKNNSLEFAYGWCEGGLRPYYFSSSENMSGSSRFLWLIALRPDQWSQVWFEGNIPSRFSEQLEAIRGKSLVFSGRQPQASIDFVACSSTDARSLSLGEYPRVTLLLDMPRCMPINKNQSQLLGVKHSDVGSVTTHVDRFLLYKCPKVKLKPTVHRSVGSVIEHKRYLPSHNHPEEAIQTSALLPIANR